ncbi:O-antigen biosynthesis aminotransferase WlbF [Microlunatus lacustris]
MITTETFIPFALPDIGEAEVEAVAETMRSGWLTTGPRAAAFEESFSSFLGEPELHSLAVNSATAGLHLALEALGVGPGDEVLVPTWTFTATAEVVRYLGAQPVLVDVDESSFNIDLDGAADAVTSRTKAIMPVHFAGLAVDRERLSAFARRFDLAVVEDAAHALPTVSGGRLVGTGTSDVVVFSFYATKTMTTGEGGMVVTKDPQLAARMRTMRLHGISRDVFNRYRSTSPAWHYEVVAPGFKYNLPDTAAAMGLVQLSRAQGMRDRRAAIAARYRSELLDLPLHHPVDAGIGDTHAWHLYVVRLVEQVGSRDDFIAGMGRAGVGCSVHFIPLHKQPYWRDQRGLQDQMFPRASRAYERVVSLPIYSKMSDDEVGHVVSAAQQLLT